MLNKRADGERDGDKLDPTYQPVWFSLSPVRPAFLYSTEREKERERERATQTNGRTNSQSVLPTFVLSHSLCCGAVYHKPQRSRDGCRSSQWEFSNCSGTRSDLSLLCSLSLFLSLSLARLRAMQYKPPPGSADAPTLFMILIQDSVGSFHITWLDFSAWTRVNCETRECSL